MLHEGWKRILDQGGGATARYSQTLPRKQACVFDSSLWETTALRIRVPKLPYVPLAFFWCAARWFFSASQCRSFVTTHSPSKSSSSLIPFITQMRARRSSVSFFPSALSFLRPLRPLVTALNNLQKVLSRVVSTEEPRKRTDTSGSRGHAWYRIY